MNRRDFLRWTLLGGTMAAAPALLLKHARAAHDAMQKLYPLARENPALFAQLVLRDEETHAPIRLAGMHKAWHDLATKHDRLIIWAHNRAGKTQQMAIARALWEIGRNPGIRVLIVSSTHDRASKILSSIASYVRGSGTYRAIFPEVVPSDPWNTTELTVKRPYGIKDPTVRALGVGGEILGARVDLLILDDVLTLDNTSTADQRNKLWTWYTNTMVGRLVDAAQVLCIGTAYYPDDLMHKLAGTGAYRAVRYPIVDDQTGASRWPERWTPEAIERARVEMGSFEFARNMLCIARDDASAVFKQAWVDVCLSLGRDKEMAYGLNSVPPGCATYTGVDLAVQQHAHSDLTVLTTIIVHPNRRKEILWIESGKWHGPEIVERIHDHHRRYHSVVLVENNAAQEFIAQYSRAQGIPTRGYTTGRNKVHPEFGVEHLATEMETGQWIFPNRGGITKELSGLIAELLQYSPKEHTGDRVMSLWLAREASRLGMIRAEVGRLDTLTR